MVGNLSPSGLLQGLQLFVKARFKAKMGVGFIVRMIQPDVF